MDLPAEPILAAHWRAMLAKWNGDGEGCVKALAEMREAADEWLRSVGKNPSNHKDIEFLHGELRASGVEAGLHAQMDAPWKTLASKASYRNGWPLPRHKIAETLNKLPIRPDLAAPSARAAARD